MDAPTGELPGRLDRSHELLYVQLVFLLVAGICVLVRIYIKSLLIKHHSVDDYLIYAAMVGYSVYGAITIDGALNGATGKHASLGYSMDRAERSLRAWYLCMVLYAPITTLIRASVCVLLLRLSTTRVHRWIILVNLAVITAISAAFFFLLVFQCTPPSYFWRQVHGAEGRCLSKLIISYFTISYSCFCALSDWCLGLLPILLLWKVNINRRTKATVAVFLSLGMVAGVVLIVRIPYITRLPPGLEFLYRSIDAAIWSVMEPALGIIGACVATFRPLFKSWGIGWNSTAESPSGHVQLSNTHRSSVPVSPRGRFSGQHQPRSPARDLHPRVFEVDPGNGSPDSREENEGKVVFQRHSSDSETMLSPRKVHFDRVSYD